MGARAPKIFETTGEDAAAESNDSVGSAHRPAHAGLFESFADHCTTAGLDDTGADKKLLFTELGVTHLPRIVLEVAQLLEHGFFAFSRARQLPPRFADQATDVPRFQQIAPHLGSLGLLAPEELCDGREVLVGVEQIYDMNGVGEVSLGDGVVVALA